MKNNTRRRMETLKRVTAKSGKDNIMEMMTIQAPDVLQLLLTFQEDDTGDKIRIST